MINEVMEGKIGKYVIEELIAEGGMARIYRARAEAIGGMGRVVALKSLRKELTSQASLAKTFLDEARISMRMTHKNICQVYGLERDGELLFLVMEYIQGIDLASLLMYLAKNNMRLPVEAAVFIAIEACSGLSYAHRMQDDQGEALGVIHRDINPQNICLSLEGEVKLIDFGIAKARMASHETQVGTIKGKFNYMSPEQARGEFIDQRCDIFALGAVLYELLSGHMLYPLGMDEQTLRQKVRVADFVPIEQRLPQIDEELKQIVAKALARDAKLRFSSSRDFLLALSHYFHRCKVYDALSLSELVTRCFQAQGKAHPSLPKYQVGTFNDKDTYEMPGLLPSSSLESRETTLIASDLAQSAVSVVQDLQDDSPTRVYSDFEAKKRASEPNLRAEMRLPEIQRKVDLSLPAPQTHRDETILVNQSELRKAGHNLWSKFKRLPDFYLHLSETHLKILLGILTVVLALALFLFFFYEESSAPFQEGLSYKPMAQAESVLIKSTPEGARLIVRDRNGIEEERGLSTPFKMLPQAEAYLRLSGYRDHAIPFSEAIDGVLHLTMQAKLGHVIVHSKPSGAEIFINQNYMGTTPFSGVLEMTSPHNLQLKLKGYQDVERVITWDDARGSLEVDIELSRDESQAP